MQEDRNELVIELIREACRAGAYSACVRKGYAKPDGFGVLADRHSARVAALANEICDGRGLIPGKGASAAVHMPRTGEFGP